MFRSINIDIDFIFYFCITVLEIIKIKILIRRLINPPYLIIYKQKIVFKTKEEH